MRGPPVRWIRGSIREIGGEFGNPSRGSAAAGAMDYRIHPRATAALSANAKLPPNQIIPNSIIRKWIILIRGDGGAPAQARCVVAWQYGQAIVEVRTGNDRSAPQFWHGTSPPAMSSF